ncbi:MAG: hypothetical protein KQH53_00790 [Desulfarculaceae bacterium]|nr:hypothetical protein [Desulfarculaceae bacterium]
MSDKPKDPITSAEPTMCVVCAWRVDCKKKYSYEQGSVIKCADYTRDMGLPRDKDEDRA